MRNDLLLFSSRNSRDLPATVVFYLSRISDPEKNIKHLQLLTPVPLFPPTPSPTQNPHPSISNNKRTPTPWALLLPLVTLLRNEEKGVFRRGFCKIVCLSWLWRSDDQMYCRAQ